MSVRLVNRVAMFMTAVVLFAAASVIDVGRSIKYGVFWPTKAGACEPGSTPDPC